MSQAKPMKNSRRITNYTADGRVHLTPRQFAQIERHERMEKRELPRTGRMRKRFEKTHQAGVRARAAAIVAAIRERRGR